MSLHVSPGVPDHWESRYADAPVFARRRWIDLGAVWYPESLMTFEAADAALAIAGAVIETPLSAARRCPWAICSGSMAAAGFAESEHHPWEGLQPDDVSPCLFLMFPYYLGDIVGADADDPVLLDCFLADLRTWASEHGCRSIAFMYGTDVPVQAAAFARAGFHRVPITESSVLPVSWSGWDGYLATFPSKRRQRILKDVAKVEAAGVTLAEEAMPDDTGELIELRCNLLRKYGALVSEEAEAAMVNRVAAMRPRESVTLMTARHQGALKSYMAFIQDGSQWTPILAGSDYSDEADGAYFATAFYLPASLAAERGIDLIDYGAGSVQTKRLRGCESSHLVAQVVRIP